MVNDVAEPCYADIVFVVDESGSVGTDNFDEIKSFLSMFVGTLPIDSGHARVGVVTFSGTVNTAQAFNMDAHSTVADVQAAIAALTYKAGATRTDLALAYVRTTMLTAGAGDRSTHPNVVIVMTDAKSNQADPTAVSIMRKFTKKLT